MSPIYDAPPHNGHLRQCEILRDVVEHRPLVPASVLPEDAETRIVPLEHRWLVVMTNVCDLLWDFEERLSLTDAAKDRIDWERSYHRISPHILVGLLYEESEIKGVHNLNRRQLERIRTSSLPTRGTCGWRQRISPGPLRGFQEGVLVTYQRCLRRH